MRNLFKYSKYYSGQEPEFVEGDIFRIIVPLDDEYSFDFGTIPGKKVPIIYQRVPINADNLSKSADNLSAQYRLILNYVKENKKITSHQAELLLKVKQRRAREILSKMTQSGMLKRQGAYRSTIYVMNDRM